MKQVTVFKAITGKLFEDQDLCSKHEDTYKSLVAKYRTKLKNFAQTLDSSVGHCGPLNRYDTSEVICFEPFRDKLAEFLARSEMGL